MKLCNATFSIPIVGDELKLYLSQGHKIFAVEQQRGRFYPWTLGSKDASWITIPLWVMRDNQDRRPGHWIWYISHELAHWNRGHWNMNHGSQFMEALKRICPKEYVHYELNYKEMNARIAGISMKDAHEAKIVDCDVDLLDLL
jgi:hypothetical protein